MKYQIVYGTEYNASEIIRDFLNKELESKISLGDSDEKKRPRKEIVLVTFDNKKDAVIFAEYFSQTCCYTVLKANQKYEDALAKKDILSWVTIQDYHLYEWVIVKEIENA